MPINKLLPSASIWANATLSIIEAFNWLIDGNGIIKEDPYTIIHTIDKIAERIAFALTRDEAVISFAIPYSAIYIGTKRIIFMYDTIGSNP